MAIAEFLFFVPTSKMLIGEMAFVNDKFLMSYHYNTLVKGILDILILNYVESNAINLTVLALQVIDCCCGVLSNLKSSFIQQLRNTERRLRSSSIALVFGSLL